jgi:hypothetical protein
VAKHQSYKNNGDECQEQYRLCFLPGLYGLDSHLLGLFSRQSRFKKVGMLLFKIQQMVELWHLGKQEPKELLMKISVADLPERKQPRHHLPSF